MDILSKLFGNKKSINTCDRHKEQGKVKVFLHIR